MEPMNILTEQLTSLARASVVLLPQLILAIMVLIATWLVAKTASALVRRLASSARVRPSLKSFMELISGIIVWVLGTMVAAVIVFPNLTPASILAGLGIGSVAIGFAFKDIFENFFCRYLHSSPA